MELIMVLLAIVLVDLAAMRWGHDSRDVMRSDERWFASHGFAWGGGARSGR
ncbi:MAG TPA: hypothetical protein VFG86_08685 [Chloroflexota bacterium]|jgi:hypothetical protein|nr:hypothetical protein [Chloroflexota bacterium]